MLPFYCDRQLVVLFLVHAPVCVHQMLHRNARQYDSMLIVAISKVRS